MAASLGQGVTHAADRVFGSWSDLALRVSFWRVHTVVMDTKRRLCLALSGRFRYDVHDSPRVRFDVGCRDLPITGLRVDSLAVIALHHTMAVIGGYTVVNRPCT